MEPLVYESALPLQPEKNSGGELASLRVKEPKLTIAGLFEDEESALLRYAIGMVKSTSAAEDLVQETFLRLHPIWSEVENPRGWVYRTLRNLALNHLRDHPAQAELRDDTASAPETPPPDQLERNEAVGLVRLFLAEMNAEDRALIQFKYNDDLKYQEISRRTGLSVSNVGYRLHHLLKSLADNLRRAGIQGSEG
ncbi:MAG TPA: RNA polymerase sigma factor [Opitutaceae bacterium]|nr:RNA polymerase sigma factor [Opitutaceae bacterium]